MRGRSHSPRRLVTALLSAALTSCASSTMAPSPPAATPQPAATPARAPALFSSAGPPQPIHLSIAYTPTDASQVLLPLAVSQGMFGRNGIQATLLRASSPDAVGLVQQARADFAAVSSPDAIDADLDGAGIVLLAAASNYPLSSLVARPELTTVADLKGKAVGISENKEEGPARLFLRHAGLSGQVDIRRLQAGSSVVSAVRDKTVAAGVVPPQTAAQATGQGLVRLASGVELGIPLSESGIITRKAFLTQHPDTVRRFLRAYQQAWTFGSDGENRARVIDAIQRETGLDPAAAGACYATVAASWSKEPTPAIEPESIANVLQLGITAAPPTAQPGDFIASAPLQQVAAAGGRVRALPGASEPNR